MICFRADKSHSCAAVSTVHQAGQAVGVGAVRHSRLFLRADLSGNIPCVLVDDGFMRIGKNHQLVRRCGSALLGLEVLADGFAQHSMTEIFLPIKDVANGGCTPSVRVCHILVSAILRLI